MPQFRKRYGRVSWFWHAVSKLYARVFGWKVEGVGPQEPKMIGIIAPHTSNWDVFLCYVLANHFRIKANWFAKHTLLYPPLGWILGPLGAIAIERGRGGNVVRQAVELFKTQDTLYLAIAPEGTRSKGSHWKTGFYYIAVKANVKIIFMYIDYRRKVMGFGPVLEPSGDIHADFEIIRDFYKDITPKYPECRSEMVIRESAGRLIRRSDRDSDSGEGT
jgi:1-acyl-sn-glycerol-3-phosphate acyltransferase